MGVACEKGVKGERSDYRTILATRPTPLRRGSVCEVFGGRDAFVEMHALDVQDGIENLILEA